jgi:hypothetical protein
MSPAHSSPAPRRTALPTFLGGGRPPGRTLVCISSLRDLRRLLVLSLVGQLLIVVLLLGHHRFGAWKPAQLCSSSPGTHEAPGKAGAHGGPSRRDDIGIGGGAPAAAITTPIPAAAPDAAPQPHGSAAP